MGEDDPPVSLEYIEDPYFPKLDKDATPSLDEVQEPGGSSASYNLEEEEEEDVWSSEAELYLRNLTLDQLLTVPDYEDEFRSSMFVEEEEEMQRVETEFVPNNDHLKSLNRIRRIRFLTKKAMQDVKVTFIDFSKPYFVKISSNDNYKKFLNITHDSAKLSDQSPGSVPSSAQEAVDELQGLTLEEQEIQKAEWSQELARVEEEIGTLRTVLASKTRRASELKRKLGITVWKEISDDVNHGLKSVKESNVYQNVEEKIGNISKAVHETELYQKTESAFKTTAEKTTSLFGGLTNKISQMKNSESFKSFEEKVGSTLENVKTKVSSSRSNSVHSFENYHEGARSTTSSVPQSPIIEEKPLPQ